MTSSPETKGTFCGVLGQRIIVSTCPLPKGSCMWKHRRTGQCTYTEDELSPATFAARVGAETPGPDVVNNLRQQLRAVLQQELAT